MKVFVSATGTDIGKTHVSCLLLAHLRAQGATTRACKPVLTGHDPHILTGTDPARLLAAQGRAVTPAAIAAIAPFRFAAPLSPDMAAAREGRTLDYAAVLAFCHATLAQSPPDTVLPNTVLIEGIGGIMVPLDYRHTVLDLMADLRLPVILVAGSYLGTLSHTLTAATCLQARGLRCVIAVSDSAQPAAGLAETVAVIARHTGLPTIGFARTTAAQPDPCAALLRACA